VLTLRTKPTLRPEFEADSLIRRALLDLILSPLGLVRQRIAFVNRKSVHESVNERLGLKLSQFQLRFVVEGLLAERHYRLKFLCVS